MGTVRNLPAAVVIERVITGHGDHAAPRQVRRIEQLRRRLKPNLSQQRTTPHLAHSVIVTFANVVIC